MKYFLVGARPVSLNLPEGLVEAWDWKAKKMVPAPDMLITVTMGVDDEGETVDIEEVTKEQFEAAQK